MSGARRAVYELLGIVLAAAMCMGLAAACRAVSAGRAREAFALDRGMQYVQSFADILAASKGDAQALADAFPDGTAGNGMFTLCFDSGMDVVPGGFGDVAWSVTAGRISRDGPLGTCTVSFVDASGRAAWSVTASWQEEG